MPARANGWWISPAVPTIANCALAALWFFSAIGGWGDAAFCGEDGRHDPGCGAGFDDAVRLSTPVAAMALAVAVTAWAMQRVRRRPGLLDASLTVAAFIWVLAEAVLFVGGHLAKQ
ncbi:hypothetical protein [Actinomadura bangladeshensis]|uniref:Uncharacterized protein n=1 Tax=Actinomadura bangladeshensis TaxID=453573 RepID=A0A4R4P4X7_9ACTN|nr:hypothetical protein [Actinomadura bangladeshensis]TDC17451.1 hypothetical protein E1284_09370 [Actinomadura bangladeshensis]